MIHMITQMVADLTYAPLAVVEERESVQSVMVPESKIALNAMVLEMLTVQSVTIQE